MFDRPAYVNAIMRFVNAPMIKVLTGIRRSGKSTILLMLIEELKKRGVPSERILSYRFDSMKYDGLTAKALYEVADCALKVQAEEALVQQSEEPVEQPELGYG